MTTGSPRIASPLGRSRAVFWTTDDLGWAGKEMFVGDSAVRAIKSDLQSGGPYADYLVGGSALVRIYVEKYNAIKGWQRLFTWQYGTYLDVEV